MIATIPLLILSALLAGPPDAATPVLKHASAGASTMETEWGVQVVALRLTAAGMMIDFRLRVLDPHKAAPLFQSRNKPLLFDESGAEYRVPVPPTTGGLRPTRPPIANRNYAMIFANTSRRLRHGDKVTIAIGDFRAENLTLE